MKKKDKDLLEMMIIGGILFVLIVIFSMFAYKEKLNEKNSNKTEVGTSEINNNSNSQTNSEIINGETINDSTNNTSSNVIGNDSSSSNEIPDNNSSITKTEDDVVNYFSNLERNINNYNDESNPSFREKAKSTFITTVDFLFYDSEINGYTFKDLSLKAKLQVLKIAASIDNKIDEYFPDYKSTIKEKCLNLKGKIALEYLETTSKLCDSIGEDSCSEARNDFKTMKQSFGYTWSIIKETGSISADKLKTLLSEWYQSIK